MASFDDYEFARIYPKGSEARNAFDAVAANPALSSYHRSFIRVEASKRSDDSESDQSTSEHPSQPQREYLVGYYSLSLRDSVEKLAQGWRAGRGSSNHCGDSSDAGNRGVDLLLICPGQSTNRVAPVHARIWLNPRSGALMLTGVEKGRAVKYEVHDSQYPLSLESGQQHVLYQRCNNFWVGRLLYSLIFQNFDDRRYNRFVQARNKIFHNYGLEIPHPRISAVWRWQDTKLGNFILQASFGHGAFGWVSVAVDACTGEPRAIKTHRVKSREDAKAVAHEIKVAQACKVGFFQSAWTTSNMLQVEQGLMPVYGDWCEHTPDCVCNIVPHLVYTASPLAKYDFSRLSRDRMNPRQVIDLFRGPLMGLVKLHRNGYIHRDVTLKNLFLMSERPPRAVLGDFGKTVQATCHRDRQIGPIKTLAPEVDGENLYDAKIDVWSLGIALMCVYSLSMRHMFERCPEDGSRWYFHASKWFEWQVKEGGLEGEIVCLIRDMLTKDPSQRPSAAQCLTYSCFEQNGPPRPKSPSAMIARRGEDLPTDAHYQRGAAPGQACDVEGEHWGGRQSRSTAGERRQAPLVPPPTRPQHDRVVDQAETTARQSSSRLIPTPSRPTQTTAGIRPQAEPIPAPPQRQPHWISHQARPIAQQSSSGPIVTPSRPPQTAAAEGRQVRRTAPSLPPQHNRATHRIGEIAPPSSSPRLTQTTAVEQYQPQAMAPRLQPQHGGITYHPDDNIRQPSTYPIPVSSRCPPSPSIEQPPPTSTMDLPTGRGWYPLPQYPQREWYTRPPTESSSGTSTLSSTSATGQKWLDFHDNKWRAQHPLPRSPPSEGPGALLPRR
ncbi:MAG: hypothetical protein Q9173_004100 [Seirophora scorigena]